MNAVKIRKWYETHCVMCTFYKEVTTYSRFNETLSVCTALGGPIDWVLSTKRNKYAFTGWFDNMMETCKFREKKSNECS